MGLFGPDPVIGLACNLLTQWYTSWYGNAQREPEVFAPLRPSSVADAIRSSERHAVRSSRRRLSPKKTLDLVMAEVAHASQLTGMPDDVVMEALSLAREEAARPEARDEVGRRRRDFDKAYLSRT